MATDRLPHSRDWLGLARLIGTLDHSLALTDRMRCKTL
jgi:hypothetical protein